jgi:cytochrome bd ubiquinol oxidase subunit II
MTELVISFVGIWTVLIAAGVFFYVLLDGFDLGIGILHGLAPDAVDRDLMMDSIAPVWDGNETWLVFGGLALLAAFPLAFAIIMPAVYFPILMMLVALVFRGVAFEFRFEDPGRRAFWDRAFHYGSIVATFAQGLVLGAFIQGFQVEGRQFTGGSLDFLTPFSVMTGFALLFGYALLGAGWLIIKTDGALQDWARRQGRFCLLAVLIAIVMVYVWTPLLEPAVAARWFSWPNILFLSPVPIITLAVAIWEWRALGGSADAAPFVAAILLFLLSYLGLALSLWPFVVPYHFTLWDAASSPSTQAFLLVGTLFLLPVILMYTGWSYLVFRGKVLRDIGYH